MSDTCQCMSIRGSQKKKTYTVEAFSNANSRNEDIATVSMLILSDRLRKLQEAEVPTS